MCVSNRIELTSLDSDPAGVEDVVDVQILHAGVSLKDDRLVTSGGRVLCAVAVASDALRAAAAAQRAAASISFDGAHRRTDIAYRQVTLVSLQWIDSF